VCAAHLATAYILQGVDVDLICRFLCDSSALVWRWVGLMSLAWTVVGRALADATAPAASAACEHARGAVRHGLHHGRAMMTGRR
jgi:hypothetical protein